MDIKTEVDRVVASNNEIIEKIDKSMAAKRNTLYATLVRIFSLSMLVGSVYAALYISAASAAVLGSLFLVTWVIYVVSVTVINIFKSMTDKKSKELELEYMRHYGRDHGPLR